MNLEWIETFLSLVDTESLSKTANILNVSQSTVSARLSALEEAVDAILVQRGRGRKGTRLTLNGRSFIPIAHAWINLFEETQNWQHNASHSGLVIGSVETLNTCVFAEFYKHLCELSHSNNLKLQIRTRVAAGLVELLKSNEIDIGLTVHPVFIPTLTGEEIFSEDYKLVAAKSHLGDPCLRRVRASSLRTSDEIYIPWDQFFVAWHEEKLGQVSETHVSADLLPLAIMYMTMPDTWMIAPHSAAIYVGKAVGKTLYDLDSPPPRRICYLIKNRTPIYDRIPSIKMFEEALRHYLQGLPFIHLPENPA